MQDRNVRFDSALWCVTLVRSVFECGFEARIEQTIRVGGQVVAVEEQWLACGVVGRAHGAFAEQRKRIPDDEIRMRLGNFREGFDDGASGALEPGALDGQTVFADWVFRVEPV